MRFVIIASRRTGSSHLVNTLSGHPDIFCHGNILDNKMMAVFWPKDQHPKPEMAKKIKQELRDLRNRDPKAFLEHVFSIHYDRPNVGFKVFQGENDELLDIMLSDISIRKIVLYRSNVLAVYSSALAARQTGQWGVEKGDQPPPSPKVVFDENDFAGFYKRYTRFYARSIDKLNKHGQQFNFLNYQDINDPHILSSSITFVGADPKKSVEEDTQRKQQIKLNPSNILERFSNVDKLEEFLHRKALNHWRYEGEAPLGQL